MIYSIPCCMIQAKELDTVAHVTVEASENVKTGNEQVRQVR